MLSKTAFALLALGVFLFFAGAPAGPEDCNGRVCLHALLVEAGLTPMQALETATTNPAELLGLKDRWRQVAPGFTANLLLLKADPPANISNTRKIDAVVVNGELLSRSELDRLLAS